ncbi:molybdate ABC transporter substrate-binding protein [Marinibacterium sp. SX1]|uniref:molybdate ABC transporter substrate-binding protein n=1 Tax=Marinibacterium sp. SX1 TaxID=3388424 RepID=UPI003D16D1A7
MRRLKDASTPSLTDRLIQRLPARALATLAAGILLAGTLAGGARAGEVTVFAAASLKTALDEIARDYADTTGDEITLSFAGSSALARQIQLGAPADLFISANEAWMDALQDDGLIQPGSRADLVGNRLVVIGHGAPGAADDDLPLAEALGQGRVAMALVDAVPAGIYGKAALQSLGLWDEVSRRVVQADNVRSALAFVALGEAPAGIVYSTDAAVEPRVSVRAVFPETSHPPIRYPGALLTGADGAAKDFLAYLQGAEARAVFDRLGFSGPEG